MGNGSSKLPADEGLYREADAGARNMLSASFSEALEHSAEFVLQLARDGRLNTSVVCVGPDVDDERYGTYATALASLRKRIAAVTAVSAADLMPYRASCLQAFSPEPGHLKRFFGK